MKKLVITIGLLAGATAAYSQGVINWSDYITPANGLPGFSITIWSPQYAGAAPVNNLGNTAIDSPAGTAAVGAGGYTGTPLSGTGYEIGLYVGTSPSAVSAAIASGSPVATDSFAAGSGGWDFNGSLPATVSGLPSGTAVYAALAAWSTAIGSPTSYASAVTDGDLFGASTVSTGTSTLGGAGSPPAVPGTLAGLGITDFTVGSVPEPSTIALGVIGASAFLMRLRRKQ
jgi:hypothetical protein